MLANIHILGIQGSGKGTQSALLVKKYKLTYLSSGEAFRERAAQNDVFGMELAKEMAAGHLIANPLLLQIAKDFITQHPISTGLLGDGLIRNLTQYTLFEPLWKEFGLDEPFLIYLDLSEEKALERIAHRVSQSEKRIDDNPEAIHRRFSLYYDQTLPVIDQFRRQNRYVAVNADQEIEVIHQEILLNLERLIPNLSHGTD